MRSCRQSRIRTHSIGVALVIRIVLKFVEMSIAGEAICSLGLRDTILEVGNSPIGAAKAENIGRI